MRFVNLNKFKTNRHGITVTVLLFWITYLGAEVKIKDDLEPFFQSYCYECHDSDSEKGDFNLETLKRSISNVTDAEHWQEVLDQINSGEMPPKKKKQPNREELMKSVSQLTEHLSDAQKLLKDSGGQIALRRLNRREFEATIKDLMGIRIRAGKYPEDSGGRFDTIGQNQSLNSLQLEQHFKEVQDIVRMGLFWAQQPREKVKTSRNDARNKEKREKKFHDDIETVRRIKKTGESYQSAGLTKAEWELHNPDSSEYKKRDTYAKYYLANKPYHHLGRMLPMKNLVSGFTQSFNKDPRAHYKIRAHAGVVDNVKIRRNIRMMVPKLGVGIGASNGEIIGSFYVTGSIDEPSTHEMVYHPEFLPKFIPKSKKQFRGGINFIEDRRGGTGTAQLTHHYLPIEKGVREEVILLKWTECEGPFYDKKSPLEELVIQYDLGKASEDVLDKNAFNFLNDFCTAAFRGKAIPSDFITKVHEYYQLQRKRGLKFHEAVVEPMAMILASTRFLYLLEPDHESESKELDLISLANRLSYFLWSCPPDPELMGVAKSGELRNTQVLNEQVTRMLQHKKADRFFSGFMSQWVHLKRFQALSLNSKLFLYRTDALIHASEKEPVEFFKTLVRENLCASNLIDSDFIVGNGILAARYGLIDSIEKDGFHKIMLPKGSPRGGLMTQAFFLSAGTMGDRTSPVIRGAMVKEILLNSPPPPPPPNVPELINLEVDPLSSVRDLVKLHQEKAQCASCHAKFDFIGLGLENFDQLGLWRDKELASQAVAYNRLKKGPHKFHSIDASGSLTNGKTFKDVYGLKEALMQEKRVVAAGLLEALLCYALGRDATFTDHPFIQTSLDKISKQNSDKEIFPLTELIQAVVTSPAFLKP